MNEHLERLLFHVDFTLHLVVTIISVCLHSYFADASETWFSLYLLRPSLHSPMQRAFDVGLLNKKSSQAAVSEVGMSDRFKMRLQELSKPRHC